MMTWLNFEWALIEFGDLILVILGAALTLGLKLAMPFMLACIVDKNIANTTTYPFFWRHCLNPSLALSIKKSATAVFYTYRTMRRCELLQILWRNLNTRSL